MSMLSTITPAIGMPMPPPIPNTALITPMPIATRAGGNVSRTIPNASGKTAPATPWITRPAISTSIELASPATTEPTANVTSTAVSTRPLPNRSPMRPSSGVATEAESRKPVMTQVAVAVEVP
jgi:hypothetical protein